MTQEQVGNFYMTQEQVGISYDAGTGGDIL